MVILEILFWVFTTGFFAGVETGFYSLNRLRLRLQTKSNSKMSVHARYVSHLLEDKQALLCMILIGTNLGVHLATVETTEYFTSLHCRFNPEVIATIILTPFVFIFGETVPKVIFRNRAESLIYRLARFISFLKILFLPFIYILQFAIYVCSFFVETDKNKEETCLTRVQLSQLLFMGAEEGLLSQYQNAIAKNIMNLNRLSIKDAMVPMDKTVTLPLSFQKEDVLEKTKTSGFSRFPVYDEKQKKVCGIVSFLDIFYNQSGMERPPLRKPVFAKNSDSVAAVLTMLFRNKNPMAIITDEQGIHIGMVTMKNLWKVYLTEQTSQGDDM